MGMPVGAVVPHNRQAGRWNTVADAIAISRNFPQFFHKKNRQLIAIPPLFPTNCWFPLQAVAGFSNLSSVFPAIFRNFVALSPTISRIFSANVF